MAAVYRAAWVVQYAATRPGGSPGGEEARVNGVHDLGGMHGLGPVQREADEPVFHAPWEGRVLAMQRALSVHRLLVIDEYRHAIERLPPADYLTFSYYQKWLAGLERLAVEKGILTREEIDARAAHYAASPDAPLPTRVDPDLVDRAERMQTSRAHFDRPATRPARFAVGDRVRTRREQPRGHTRLPRYARGRLGTIHAVHGFYVFPDTVAHGAGEDPQPLYSVCFEGAELWGESTEPRERLYLDLWERYLEPGA